MEEPHFFTHSRKRDTKEGIILLHGQSKGIDSTFMRDLFESLRTLNADVLAFDFPYIPYVEGSSEPSKGLVDEVKALDEAYNYLRTNRGKTKLTIVGKSLGAIVASRWLGDPSHNANLYIMGYVPGKDNMQTVNLRGSLKGVVQGRNDQFANPEYVRADLENNGINPMKIPIVEIQDADHSYHDSQGNPTHQAKAIDSLMQLMNK